MIFSLLLLRREFQRRLNFQPLAEASLTAAPVATPTAD